MKWIMESIENKEKISLNMVIDKNSNDFPLLLELKNTIQDNEWHNEGDVHIHTQMVIDEVYKIFEENVLNNQEKYILLMSAIFHDIAKPLNTKTAFIETRGRECVIAPKHEINGASYLYYPFIEMDISYRDEIIDVILNHNKPKLMVVKDIDDKWAYKSLTEKVSGKIHYLFSIADIKGRNCSDKEEQLFYLEMFKSGCLEHFCFEIKSNFNKELTDYFYQLGLIKDENSINFLVGKAKNAIANYNFDIDSIYYKNFENANNFNVLAISCGISGSGKTTNISKYIESLKEINQKETIVIELDEIRKEFKSNDRKKNDSYTVAKYIELLKINLAKKVNIIIDATNLRFDFREKAFTFGSNYGAFNVLIMNDNSPSECIKNDATRTSRNLGEDIINKQISKFQMPTQNEYDLQIKFDNRKLKNKQKFKI